MKKEIIIILGVLGVLGILGVFVLRLPKNEVILPLPTPTQIPATLTPEPTQKALDGCKIGGCSGQVCSDKDVITTCEYTEAYACYHSALCERQSNGKCGWTETEELKTCLLKAKGNSKKAPLVQ